HPGRRETLLRVHAIATGVRVQSSDSGAPIGACSQSQASCVLTSLSCGGAAGGCGRLPSAPLRRWIRRWRPEVTRRRIVGACSDSGRNHLPGSVISGLCPAGRAQGGPEVRTPTKPSPSPSSTSPVSRSWSRNDRADAAHDPNRPLPSQKRRSYGEWGDACWRESSRDDALRSGHRTARIEHRRRPKVRLGLQPTPCPCTAGGAPFAALGPLVRERGDARRNARLNTVPQASNVTSESPRRMSWKPAHTDRFTPTGLRRCRGSRAWPAAARFRRPDDAEVRLTAFAQETP